MININHVTIAGRLVRDPELRKTGSGVSVLRFTVAVSRKYRNDQGKYESDFISCIAWRQQAEYITTYGHKGDTVSVDGSIVTGSYQDNSGRTIYTTDINAESVSMDRKQNENTGSGSYQQQPQQHDDFGGSNVPDLPFL